jgi:hypothetical protein
LQKSNDQDFYNLETLCHFIRITASEVPYVVYVKLATEANIDIVLYKDEGTVLEYLHGRIGERTPDRIKNISYWDLNQRLVSTFPDESVVDGSASRSKLAGTAGKLADPVSARVSSDNSRVADPLESRRSPDSCDLSDKMADFLRARQHLAIAAGRIKGTPPATLEDDSGQCTSGVGLGRARARVSARPASQRAVLKSSSSRELASCKLEKDKFINFKFGT